MSIVVLLDAVTSSGPGAAVTLDVLKTEFSMQVVVSSGTPSEGGVQVWLEQSIDGVNFSRVPDNATGGFFSVSASWSTADPVGSNMKHFPSGNILVRIVRANWSFISGGTAATVTARLAAI